jgi:uncharacterized protein YndB with AHSA1/START domain
MEQKTIVRAEDGKQDLFVSREFDLPVAALFRAHVDPEIVSQWMGTKVLKLDGQSHGSYRFETTDPRGQVHRFHGVIHALTPERKIVRTFEMENMPFGVQLEFLEFEPLSAATSKLTMHMVYESVAQRDQVLKIGMVQGINFAHNRLQTVAAKSI